MGHSAFAGLKANAAIAMIALGSMMSDGNNTTTSKIGMLRMPAMSRLYGGDVVLPALLQLLDTGGQPNI